ncbi:MAG: lysophospholipid acyltransferase family protein [Deltaproteobacteria bacterium]|jgi:1-acyl-sn-glycerol-3-phosphate acyltransferase|nr:lysophospholipid acyltransferase family protein [Deltaproteobacteria bacterium]
MIRRRLLTIPAYLLGCLVWIVAIPIWAPLALVVDLLRQRGWVALRVGALITVYLSCEVLGMLASLGLWLSRPVLGIDSARWLDLHFWLEAWWGSTIFAALVLLFGLRFEMEGEEDSDLGCGPYILLLRHVSAADTLLASALVSRPHGLRLRYVLKKELLWDPCLDIVGNRLPNAFVDRLSGESDREVDRVRTLAEGLGSRDGILIYPEGTRFSESKRARLLERLRKEGNADRIAYAESLTEVLPPKPGGVLGLLEAAPEADVLVCAHVGFEGIGSVEAVWAGALLHRRIRIQLRRISRELIPAAPEGRMAWLMEEWQRVDDWLQGARSSEER